MALTVPAKRTKLTACEPDEGHGLSIWDVLAYDSIP